jgi:hypothetical protein
MVEKDERAHHAAARGGQHPADFEPAEIASALRDHHLDHIRLRFEGVAPLQQGPAERTSRRNQDQR